MRLLLVGAFPYPYAQGSQVYFQEQAHALRNAGAQVELLTYASGDHEGPSAKRALADFTHHAPPAATAPRRMRSGPSMGKPFADLALASKLRQLLASNEGEISYDAVLTHNAEATFAALYGRHRCRTPIVYCIHTLLANELSAYLKSPKSNAKNDSRPRRPTHHRGLDRLGHRVDAALAKRVDGWIALTPSASHAMRHFSTCPGAIIPPPIPDPEPRGTRLDPSATLAESGLEVGRYFLYSGNLDGYQEIETLSQAASLLARAAPDPARRPRIVIASHDGEAGAPWNDVPEIDFCHTRSAEQALALMAGARACLLMREAVGGYPIKLANALSLGTPSIVFHDREWGLRDRENTWVASRDRAAVSLAEAMVQLAADDSLVEKLRRGARTLYRERHRPESVAAETLALVEEVLARRVAGNDGI